MRDLASRAAVGVIVLVLAYACGELLIHLVDMVGGSLGGEQSGGHTG